MISQTAWKFARGTATATLALLASAILSPSRAEASCGDYVMIGGHHAGLDLSGAGSGIPEHDSDVVSNITRLGTHDPTVPRCHGPSCSNRSIPPLAPAPKIEVTVERWAISGQTGPSLLPESDLLLADVQALPCDGFGLSILRPPR